MTAHVQQASMLSGRYMTFMAVIGLHALMIGALIAIKIAPDIAKAPLALQWVNSPPPDDSSPPLPTIAQAQRAVTVPQVIIQIPEYINVEPTNAIAVQAAPSQASAQEAGVVEAEGGSGAATVLTPPARVTTALQYRITRPTDEYYPDTSKVIQEQGVAVVRVCVDGAGRMSGAPVIETSSGYKRLDQAALRWARESLSFKPATENGAGVPACKGFRVNFDLH
jgi:TonB family protein